MEILLNETLLWIVFFKLTANVDAQFPDSLLGLDVDISMVMGASPYNVFSKYTVHSYGPVLFIELVYKVLRSTP